MYSQDDQFSSPKLQEARPAGPWQGSDGWLPLTEEDTIQEGITRVQMDSDGFRWVQMGSDGWLPLTEEDTIQKGIIWIQMGSDGWLSLTEEDTIQEGVRWIQMGSDG